MRSALRPDTPGGNELPPRYGSGDKVESIVSPGGAFRIHFTRSGAHAVSSVDIDNDQVPDYVELVAKTYDAVHQTFHQTLGFAVPPNDSAVADGNGGDERFDVYLLDFGGSSDGAYRREKCGTGGCAGYMVMENDFKGYAYPTILEAVSVLSSHEYFHAIQAAYQHQSSTVLSEGSAVWATERYAPDTNDLERFARQYLDRTDRSLATDPIGPVQGFAYGSSLWFWFLSERFGDQTILSLWKELGSSGQSPWTKVLDAVLARDAKTSFAAAFIEFQQWNARTAKRADPTKSYATGAKLPAVAAEPIKAPYADELVRLFPAAARFYRLDPAGVTRVVATIEGSAPLEEVALLLMTTTDDRVVEIIEGSAEDGGQSAVAGATLGAATGALVALVDGRTDGESQRVSLCIGSEGQVRDCRGLAPADGGTSDGGPSTTDSSPDGAGGGGGGGGGCAVAPIGDGDPWLPPLALVLALLLLRPKRRRRVKAA